MRDEQLSQRRAMESDEEQWETIVDLLRSGVVPARASVDPSATCAGRRTG